MKGFKRLIPLILIMISLIVVPLGVRADFGDYAGDYDYGDSDDSWDWGSDDDDYGYYGGSGNTSGGETVLEAVVFVIIAVAVLYSIINNKKGGSNNGSVNTGSRRTASDTLRNIAEYNSIDPNFSAAQFSEKIANLYVQFQNCWQAKDISSLRPYMTDAMFAQMDRQLGVYRQNYQTNHIDRISVLGVQLLGWRQESGTDVIIAQLNTRIVDYVTDDRTGNIVRGSNTVEKFMTYEWSLVRTTGVMTGVSSGTTGQTCPYCGAKVNINHSAVCEYCDSVLTTDSFDWAVSNIRGISQRSR